MVDVDLFHPADMEVRYLLLLDNNNSTGRQHACMFNGRDKGVDRFVDGLREGASSREPIPSSHCHVDVNDFFF